MKFIHTLTFCLLPLLTFSQEKQLYIDKYITSYYSTSDFFGCVLINQADETLFSKCYGNANYSFGTPNSQQTKFKIGSVSKQFTAAAILKLEEEGLLSVEDSLGSFFDKANYSESVTLHQLLTHTGGIIDIFSISDFASLQTNGTTFDDLITILFEQELTSEPGSSYQYSNGGFAMLAAVIEKVSGQPYKEYLSENIFIPLGMNSTGHQSKNEVISQLAVGYDPYNFEDIIISEYVNNDLLKGSGSLYSTNADIKNWISSLNGSSFFSKESKDKFFTNYGNSYGYGISVYGSFGRKVFGHDGRISGYIADYLFYEEDELSIIITGNIQTGVSDFFRRDLAAILFEEDFKSRAKTSTPSYANSEELKDLVGDYSFGPGFTVYVELIDGLLKARANEGGYSELVPLSDGAFFSRTLYSTIKFENIETDSKKMIWINNDGNSFEGTRK